MNPELIIPSRAPADSNEFLISVVFISGTIIALYAMKLWSTYKSPSAQAEKALKADINKELYVFNETIHAIRRDLDININDVRHYQEEQKEIKRTINQMKNTIEKVYDILSQKQ